MNPLKTEHVVIAGAGFAGIQMAKRLNGKDNIRVTLIDQNNYHQFQPLFYQVATAGLDASNISFPLRKMFQNSRNVAVRLCRILCIHPHDNQILTDEGAIYYDRLVLATGCTTDFYGNENIERHALPMKSTTEAIAIRNSILQMLEKAANASQFYKQHLYNIVIVGGGPTGVELSGALTEMKNNMLPKDYPELDFSLLNIYLIEGSNSTLGSMSRKSQFDSERYLRKMGVRIIKNLFVSDYDGRTIELSNGESMRADIVIWAAGIKGNVPEGLRAECITRGRRIKVDAYHKVHGYDNVYAIGDVSLMTDVANGKGHPQVCKAANDQGKNLADIILNKHQGAKPFVYRDLGSMATIGRNKAVVDDFPIAGFHFKGWLAWMSWMGFHLLQLLGAKNKVQVVINWVYHYFTYDQSLRLIFQKSGERRADASSLSAPAAPEFDKHISSL